MDQRVLSHEMHHNAQMLGDRAFVVVHEIIVEGHDRVLATSSRLEESLQVCHSISRRAKQQNCHSLSLLGAVSFQTANKVSYARMASNISSSCFNLLSIADRRSNGGILTDSNDEISRVGELAE